jgi:hypothetical protein
MGLNETLNKNYDFLLEVEKIYLKTDDNLALANN